MNPLRIIGRMLATATLDNQNNETATGNTANLHGVQLYRGSSLLVLSLFESELIQRCPHLNGHKWFNSSLQSPKIFLGFSPLYLYTCLIERLASLYNAAARAKRLWTCSVSRARLSIQLSLRLLVFAIVTHVLLAKPFPDRDCRRWITAPQRCKRSADWFFRSQCERRIHARQRWAQSLLKLFL